MNIVTKRNELKQRKLGIKSVQLHSVTLNRAEGRGESGRGGGGGVHLSFPLFVSVFCLYVCPSICLSPSACSSLSLFLQFPLSHPLSLSLFLRLSLSLPPFLSLSLSLSARLSTSTLHFPNTVRTS